MTDYTNVSLGLAAASQGLAIEPGLAAQEGVEDVIREIIIFSSIRRERRNATVLRQRSGGWQDDTVTR